MRRWVSVRFRVPAGNRRLQRSTLRRVGVRAGVLALLLSVLTPLAALPASAAGQTVVSLEFDDGSASQYTLAYQRALQPAGVNATFFVKSGTIGNTGNMTWTQVQALAAAGNDIGGKTVSSANLTTDPNPTAQVCNDRQALIQHGLSPVAFAYPGGAYNSSVQTVVKNCGYGNGRGAGGVSASGPTYAETTPPANWLATKTWTPPTPATSETQLSDMQAEVNAAAAHSGGWVQIVLSRVCSQTYDPGNYTSCVGSSRPVELATLNGFLAWMANAGQTGGAPAGATLSTVRNVIIGADTTAPATTIACNGAACSASTYTGSVSVTLAATDTGSGVASTHYTTDGSTPTLSSPTYTGAFLVPSTATVKYASWDIAGHAETAHSQTITVQQQSADTTPPTTTISCNGAACSSTAYTGPVTVTLSATDNPGGYGVANTYYTTDGSTPTTSSTVYTGPFTVKQNSTVQFFSTDLAGNAEQPKSQAISFALVVSLTFDDGLASQYMLAFLHALQPHNMTGTFFINTGNTSNPADAGAMTWSELTALNDAGNEIGGHTLDESDLTTDNTQTATTEVCQDRQNLLNHGFYPTSFAYPFGAVNSIAESIVQGCGYSQARTAGGVDVSGPGQGPVYAETIPPKDPLSIRSVYHAPGPNGTNAPPLQLSDMQAQVNGAAQNGGGWITLTFHQVCDQTLDPSDYSSCIGNWGPVELSTLNSLLDWLQNAGQPGGAPAGTVVKTVSQVMNGPDTQAPITTLECDGSPCQSSTYNGSTTVSLFPKDPGGSGVKATYYTTDGSTPTTSSPVWNGQGFTITQPTTFNFFSVDNAGNTEPVETTTVQVQPNADPVIGAAGDIACDPSASAFNNGQGTNGICTAASTASLLTGLDAVFAMGDNQYTCGGLSAFQQSFGPTWGTKRAIMYPVPGDQDLKTSGGTNCPSSPGAYYQQYFSTSGSWYGSPLPSVVNVNPNVNYYSFNLGTWHIIALNTGQCELQEDNNQPATFCAAGSPMEQWLQNDLANDTASCTLAFMQDPRWASTASGDGGDNAYQALWQDMYNGGVDVAMGGNYHWYERFAPLNASGQIDNTFGIRQFIVGTGGAGLSQPGTEVATSQVLNNTTHGIIKMTLHNGSYDWQFINNGESSFTDSGTASCHGKP
jgi:peptidoglycan/xylan/chitin deacetylase (PgdA/CDA1 family)